MMDLETAQLVSRITYFVTRAGIALDQGDTAQARSLLSLAEQELTGMDEVETDEAELVDATQHD